MKTYTIEFDDKVVEQIEVVARDTAKVPPDALIRLLVTKALCPERELDNMAKKEI